MANVTTTETTATTGETEMVTAKAGKSPRRKINSADATEAALQAKTAKQSAAKSRKYSDEERLEKVRLIDAQISDGKRTLKEAVKDAGDLGPDLLYLEAECDAACAARGGAHCRRR